MVGEEVGPALETVREAAIVRLVASIARFDIAADDLRVRLSAAGGRIIAQATAAVAGRRIRVQVAAATLGDAVGDLDERLCRRLLEAAGCWSPRPWPDTDDASVPTRIPPHAHRPLLGAAPVARFKAVALARCPVPVAVAAMDLMDYPAHLFVDGGTGSDAVVYRAGPTGYRLVRLRPAAPPDRDGVPLTVDPRPAPVLTRPEAVKRLDETGLGHLFFADPGTGRGHLLYRRFDGHYGLVKGIG